MELFVITSTPAKTPEDIKATFPNHLACQQQLEQRGVLAFAGPLSDETGDLMQGTGMIVYRAANLNDARGLAEADPMHQRGVRTYSNRRWLVNEGSMQPGLKLSAQSISFE